MLSTLRASAHGVATAAAVPQPNAAAHPTLPAIMRKFTLPAFGAAQLRVVDTDLPEPGPGEVLVRWRAWSLNYRDLVVVDGSYLPNLALPFTPLSDAAGEIAAVGENVTRWKVGDRVVSLYVRSWLAGGATDERIAGTVGGPIPGLLSEYTVVPELGVLPLAAHLTFAEGATLPIAAVTAWNALFCRRDLHPGDTVVFEGTGGVSLFGLQLARRAGLRTIITSSSDAKLERARAEGAEQTINYRRHPEWSKEVRRMTEGRGASLILDIGGGQTLPEALRAVRTAGRICVIGFLSGKQVALDVLALLRSLATVHGVRVGSREMAMDLLAFLALHPDLKPVIDAEFPFSAAPEAFAQLAKATHFGKIVIVAD